MAGKIITSEELAQNSGAPEQIRSGALSPGVRAGPFVYVSGTGARDLGKDIRGQTEEILGYISRVLAEAGCEMRDVVKIQAFITRAEDYAGYNEVRRKYFPKDPPASMTVVAAMIFPGMLVEVDAVACKEKQT